MIFFFLMKTIFENTILLLEVSIHAIQFLTEQLGKLLLDYVMFYLYRGLTYFICKCTGMSVHLYVLLQYRF